MLNREQKCKLVPLITEEQSKQGCGTEMHQCKGIVRRPFYCEDFIRPVSNLWLLQAIY